MFSKAIATLGISLSVAIFAKILVIQVLWAPLVRPNAVSKTREIDEDRSRQKGTEIAREVAPT